MAGVFFTDRTDAAEIETPCSTESDMPSHHPLIHEELSEPLYLASAR
jgi:hypothetical protein